MVKNSNLWKSFFIQKDDLHDRPIIKGYDYIINSFEYKNLSTTQKIELVTYIIENWNDINIELSIKDETRYLIPEKENEYSQWELIQLPQLKEELKFEIISQERNRIKKDLKSIDDINAKIHYLEYVYKELQQDILSKEKSISEVEELAKIIQTEIKYWENQQTRDLDNSPLVKINWSKNPSHLAYILKQFVLKGYIQLPTEIHVHNKKQVAEYFLKFFDVSSNESFIKLFQDENQPTHATKKDLNQLIDNSKPD